MTLISRGGHVRNAVRVFGRRGHRSYGRVCELADRLPASGRDATLWVLTGLLAAETIATMALSLAGVTPAPHGPHDLDSVKRVLGLSWFGLVIALLARAAHVVRRLRDVVSTQDHHITAVAATSHDWLWESTTDFVATYCSPATATILGRAAEEIVGTSLFELVCDDDLPMVRAVLAQAISNRTGWRHVGARWKHADGHSVPMQGSALPMCDRHGNLIGFRGTRRATSLDAETLGRVAQVTSRIRDVLDGPSLPIALQPIVSFDSGLWAGVEAFARFPDSRPPDLWFAEAAEAGLGVELELFAATAAIAVAVHLPDRIYVSINASPALILDPRLAALFESSPVAPDRVVVELTEHVAITRYEEIRHALAPLRREGLRLAIDDAGAGYSSFTHVLRLHPDIIKLDRSLIAGIDSDPARRAFVTAITVLGSELRATTTAEGVETMAELTTLSSLGIHHAQGYLLARPTTEKARWYDWRDSTWPVRAMKAVDKSERPSRGPAGGATHVYVH